MSIDTKALIAATPATVALVRRELASELRQAMDERDAAQAEARELRERAEKAERNYQWIVERAADQHLSGYRELARRAADAENVADGLRAELARVRELAAKWRAAPQNPDEPLLAMAADELEAALSKPAEQHDPLAVSDHCGECGEPEPECVCGEQPDERESLPLTFTQGVLCSLSILDRYGDSIAYREVADPHDLNQLWEEADEFDREHLVRHGYRPTPAAQESGDA